MMIEEIKKDIENFFIIHGIVNINSCNYNRLKLLMNKYYKKIEELETNYKIATHNNKVLEDKVKELEQYANLYEIATNDVVKLMQKNMELENYKNAFTELEEYIHEKEKYFSWQIIRKINLIKQIHNLSEVE